MAAPERKLHPEMYDLIMHKLERNGAAQENMREKKDPRRLVIMAAEPFVGTREQTGNNDGKIIELFQETIGDPVKEPYCLAGPQTIIAFVEKVYGIKSPIYPTEHCMTCWHNTPQQHRVLYSPNPGAIGIYNHRGTDSGHATLFVEKIQATVKGYKRNYAQNIEWNTTQGQNPDGEIVREGGGIYWTKRPWLSNVGSMWYIGHLKPF